MYNVSGKSKFKEEYYVRAYTLCAQGLRPGQVAQALGVDIVTLKKWVDTRPAFADAIKRGRKRAAGGGRGATFQAYVFDRLPQHLQALWKNIEAADKEDADGNMTAMLLKGASKRSRQQLFLYALTNSNFNASEACRRTQVPFKTYQHWAATDDTFSELCKEIHEHKKNFFESALVGLVKEGDVSAVLFANRTLNKDRGYGDRKEVEVKGSIDHNHSGAVLNIDALALPVNTRKQILRALREKKRQALPGPNTIDASFNTAEAG